MDSISQNKPNKVNDVGDLEQVMEKLDALEQSIPTLINEALDNRDFISKVDAKELINKRLEQFSPTVAIDKKIEAWFTQWSAKMATFVTEFNQSLFKQQTAIDQNTKNIDENTKADAIKQQLISDISGSLRANADSQERIEVGIKDEREQNEILRGRVLKVEGEVLKIEDNDKEIQALKHKNEQLTKQLEALDQRDKQREIDRREFRERLRQGTIFFFKYGVPRAVVGGTVTGGIGSILIELLWGWR